MWSELTNLIDVRRQTAALFGPSVAATTLSWDRQPGRAALVEFNVHNNGTAGTGSLTITGTSGGVAATETVTVTGPGFYRSSRAWTALAGLTTSGLADEASVPTLEARAVGQDGSPCEAPYLLVAGWPAAINVGGGSLLRGGDWPNDRRFGRAQTADATAIIAWDETWELREGDLITDDIGRRWQVVGDPRIAGTTMYRHWFPRLKRHES
jgi:hypothetical protein